MATPIADSLASVRQVFGASWNPAPIFSQKGLTNQGILGAVRVQGTNDVYTIGPGGGLETADSFKQKFGTSDQTGIVGLVTPEQAKSLGITAPVPQATPTAPPATSTTTPPQRPPASTTQTATAPRPPLITDKANVQEGQFLQVPGSPEVYQYKNGEIRHIINPEVGQAIGLQASPEPGGGWLNTTSVSQETLASFKVGIPISSAPSLTDNPEDYIIDLINRTEDAQGVTEEKARISGLVQQVADFLENRTPKSKLLEQELERRGVPEANDILTNLNNEILTEQQLLDALPDNIRQATKDFLITEPNVQRLITAESTKPAKILADLLAQRGVLQDQIDRATQFSSLMADTEYADEAAKLDALKFMLDYETGVLNSSEQKALAAVNGAIEVRKAQMQNELDIKNANRQLVLSLAQTYPAAKIDPNDTIETAMEKARPYATQMEILQIQQIQAQIAATNRSNLPSPNSNAFDLLLGGVGIDQNVNDICQGMSESACSSILTEKFKVNDSTAQVLAHTAVASTQQASDLRYFLQQDLNASKDNGQIGFLDDKNNFQKQATREDLIQYYSGIPGTDALTRDQVASIVYDIFPDNWKESSGGGFFNNLFNNLKNLNIALPQG